MEEETNVQDTGIQEPNVQDTRDTSGVTNVNTEGTPPDTEVTPTTEVPPDTNEGQQKEYEFVPTDGGFELSPTSLETVVEEKGIKPKVPKETKEQVEQQYPVDFGNGIRINFPQDPTDEQLLQVQEKLNASGLLNKEANDQMEISRETLKNNETFKNAFKAIYERIHGEKFKGSDDELVSAYYTRFRIWEQNIAAQTILYSQLQGDYFDNKNRANLAILFHIWNRAVPFYKEGGNRWLEATKNPIELAKFVKENGRYWGEFAKDTIVAQGSDPFNYLFGASMAKSIVGAVTEKAGANVIKNLIAKRIAILLGVSEGFIQGSVGSLAEQAVFKDLGIRQEDVSALEAFGYGTATAVFGGWFAKRGAETAIGKGEEVVDALSRTEWYKKRAGKLTPITEDAIAHTVRVEESKNTMVNAYAALKKARENRLEDPSTYDRAYWDAAREHYHTILTQFITPENVKARFKTPDDAKVGINEALSKDILEVSFRALGVKPKDTIVDIARLYMNPKTSAIVAEAVAKSGKIKMAGEEAYTAMLIALEGALENEGKRLKVMEGDKDDITAIFKTWIDVQTTLSNRSTSLGRQFQYLKNRTQLNFTAEDYAGMSIQDRIDTVEKAFGLGGGDSTTEFLNDTATYLRDTTNKGIKRAANWINSLYINNLLGGFKTVRDNFIFSGLNLGFIIGSRALGSFLSGKEIRQEALAQLKELFTDHAMYSETLRLTAKAFSTSTPQLDNRFYLDQASGFTKNIDFGAVMRGESKIKGLMSDDLGNYGWLTVLGNCIKLLSDRGMVTVDEVVSNIAFRSRAAAIAYVEELAKDPSNTKLAWEVARQRAGQAVKEQIDATITGTPSLNPLVKKALQESREARFALDLESGGDVGSIGRLINHVTHPKYKPNEGTLVTGAKAFTSVFGTTIAPITRNPANIVNFVFETTPAVAFLSKRFRRDIKSGDPEKVGMAVGKLGLGTMLWGAALYSLFNDEITGEGPLDYSQRRVLTGGGEGQIRRPSNTVKGVSLQRTEPFGKYWKIAGAVQDIFKYGSDMDRTAAFSVLAVTLADKLTDVQGAQGLSRLNKLIQDIFNPSIDSDTKLQKGSVWAGRTATPFVPWYRIMDEMDFDEEAVRVVESGLEVILNKIPFISEKGDVRRDIITGEPLARNPVLFDRPEIPYKKFNVTTDRVNRELINVAPKGIEYIPRKLDGVNLKEFIFNKDTEQSYYDRLQELVGKVKSDYSFDEYKGKTLVEALNVLFDSDLYKKTSEVSNFGIDEATDQPLDVKNPREELIYVVVKRFRNMAIAKLYEEILEKVKQGDPEAIKMYNSMQNQAEWKAQSAQDVGLKDLIQP